MKRLHAMAAALALVIGVGAVSAQQGVNIAQLQGSIASAGSSTVAPVTARMMDLFAREGFSGGLDNAVLGTGAGFQRFCQDLTADISNASRPINDEERAACRANGREPLELVIAVDALAVVVAANNPFVTGLSLDDLAAIYSGRATVWSSLNPAYPNQPIFTFAPGTDSGTFDYFVEEVFDNDPREILRTPGIQFSESDAVLVSYIEANPYAIGFFGYAYYYPERTRLRALEIDGAAPNQANAASGAYPLSRPLFIYTAPSILREKPQVEAFVRFYLENVSSQLGTGGRQIGYFPVTDAIMAENYARLEAALSAQ